MVVRLKVEIWPQNKMVKNVKTNETVSKMKMKIKGRRWEEIARNKSFLWILCREKMDVSTVSQPINLP